MANLLEELNAKQTQEGRETAQPEMVGGFSLLDELRVKAQPQQEVIQDDSIRRIDDNGADSISPGVPQEQDIGGGVTVEDIDKALLDIPGAASLSEFAAGVNRSVLGALDFLGPDNVNAILELAGSEKRVPTLTETLATPPESFVEGLPGRVLGTAGEVAGVAAGTGAALRAGAAQLSPLAQASEGALRGILRQTGQVAPRADIAVGAAAGAGEEIGREVGGETGALIGAVATPVALSIPINTAKSAANSLLKKAAPSVDKLKDTARGIYQSLDESGVSVPSSSFDDLADDIAKTLRKQGSDVDLTPKAVAVVNRLQSEKGAPKTLTELDTLRRVARNAADSLDKSEQRLGNIAIEKIDNFLDGVGDKITDDLEVGQAFKSARDLWQRARKTEVLEQAIVNAESQASGFENGIRTQFRSLLKRINTGKQKGFTAEETNAIKKVVDGTNVGNIARFFGKFGILDGVTSRSLTTLGGAGLAGAAGGTGAAVTVPLVGQLSGALAQRMTLNNARMAQNIVKAGKNSKEIARAYVKNTPKADRSPNELAELFLTNKVPVEKINTKTSPRLISDAAVIAAVAKSNDEKEEQ